MSRICCRFAILTFTICSFILPTFAQGDRADAQNSHSSNLRNKGLILVKTWCLIVVFLGTFLGGISPYFYRWNNAFLVLGTQFAGGVFLGTALMHFLSDANKTFHDRTDTDYPFAFMLATAGYLLTMFGDSVIQWIFTKEVAAGHVDVEKGVTKSSAITETARDATNVHLGSNETEKNADEDKCSCCGETLNACTCAEKVSDPVEMKNVVKATLIKTTSFGDTVLLILALCFHSVFEGIAIGVAETKGDAWKALWTVCLHKFFAAIAMGIALLRMIPNRPLVSCAAYAFSFAISSPIGVVIGIIIDATTEGPAADWIFAISMGLACGVFIYVAINHLLAKGYVPPCQVSVDTPFYKFLSVLVGAAIIAVVMIWDT